MAPAPKPRLLVFVIAYYAEKTLQRVLERIPNSVFTDYQTEILVVDDASDDRTFDIGQGYKTAHPDIGITVLRNEYNQGYGGNQKVGYTYAIEHGFDFVAMVHGDGQYAPEELPRLLLPLRNGEADAVFGSRMMTAFGALRGGMPLYKFVGNRVLTTTQNFLLGTKLSEFHSGYRIYSVKALEKLHFLLNSNDFHFDTEIIIQHVNAGLRIAELSIPTYYGDEISRVNGIKYAKDVVLSTLKNVFHRTGLLWQRRFDPKEQGNTHYGLKLGYPSSHQFALDAVPPGSTVIDIGSGPGGIARQLVERGCDVTVVDQHPPTDGPGGETGKVRVVVQDLDQPPAFDVKPHTHLLLLDVIEHLRNPEGFIKDLRAQFTHEPKTLILSTPNVAFIVQRLMLLLGQFNYGKAGILDRTHRRLFTFRSLRHLLRDHGFRIKRIRGVPAPFPKVLGNNAFARAVVGLNSLLIWCSKSLFSYQIFVVAETTPDTNYVVRQSEEKSCERAARLEGQPAKIVQFDAGRPAQREAI